MFCTQCGTTLPAGVPFCSGCGAVITAAAQQPQYVYGGPTQPPRVYSGPTPPDCHWALVLVLSVFTFGLFSSFWMYKQATFVKKIDPSSNAPNWMVGVGVGLLGNFALYALALVISLTQGSWEASEGVRNFADIVGRLGTGFAIGLAFVMRSSLLRYYNYSEPIGLKLSPVMTFFFQFIYIQYHFSRIAAGKRMQPVVAYPVQA